MTASAMSRRLGVWWAGLVVAGAAAAATAHGLYAVATASGVPAEIAVLYPVMTDGLALVAYSATNRPVGPGRRYAWTVVIAAAGLSGLAQAFYLAAGGLEAAPVSVRFGLGVAPAVAAAAVAHLLHLIRLAGTLSTSDEAHRHPAPSKSGPPAAPQPGSAAPLNGAVQSQAVQPVGRSVHEEAVPVQPVAAHPSAPGGRLGASGESVNGEQGDVQPSAIVQDRTADGVGEAVGGGATQRAEHAARLHRDAHGVLPTATELVRLTGVSRGTAGTALKGLRDSADPASPILRSPSTAAERSAAAPDNDQTEQTTAPATDQYQPPREDHPTHPPSKIHFPYTPRHHDPQEDQLHGLDEPLPEPATGR
jgi:hypothetical protein